MYSRVKASREVAKNEPIIEKNESKPELSEAEKSVLRMLEKFAKRDARKDTEKGKGMER